MNLKSTGPGKWLPSSTYAERHEAEWHAVYPQMPNTRRSPVYCGALAADLQRNLDPLFPEAGVLQLDEALLYGEAGWVFASEGYLLPDHSWYGRHVDEMKIPACLPRAKRLNGVCLSLASDFAVRSYGHFLLDSLSRLELFIQAGLQLSDIDHLFIAKPPSVTAQRLFDQLNIPSEKCIWADGSVAVRTETLLVPTFPGTRRNYPTWVPDFLRRTFGRSPSRASRRLYISRTGGRRNALNEQRVNGILIEHGFEIYEPSRQADTISDFVEAAVVVGPHGGGLTDLAFCQPGTKVLEFIPTDHVYPYYYTLSDAAGLEHRCLVCRSTEERGPDAWGPSVFDFQVDEHELIHALDVITGEATATSSLSA